MNPPRAGSIDAWWVTACWVMDEMRRWNDAKGAGFGCEALRAKTEAWASEILIGEGDIRARCRRVSASMARYARKTKDEFDASVARSLSHALSDSPRTGNPRLRSKA